jgi:hypothetical protein
MLVRWYILLTTIRGKYIIMLIEVPITHFQPTQFAFSLRVMDDRIKNGVLTPFSMMSPNR